MTLHPQKFGKYILVDLISSGGMAEVFLGKAAAIQGFEKLVAVKRILPTFCTEPDFVSMFIDEAKISARLSHSNIGQVFEFGQVRGRYYLAMEFINGKDLRTIWQHLHKKKRPMDVRTAVYIASCLCQALDYAHRLQNPDNTALGLIHRDVSPPNVIISYDGAVKLIDFGIARAASRITKTRTGKLKGKLSYMSPEQVQGQPLDQRTDIFSVGILLYELLTNRRLFLAKNHLATINLVRLAEIEPPSTHNPDVPLEVERIVLKALTRDRTLRYTWASEMNADIQRYFARTGQGFEAHHLAEWMHAEFAPDFSRSEEMIAKIHHLNPLEAKEEDDNFARSFTPQPAEQDEFEEEEESSEEGDTDVNEALKAINQSTVNLPDSATSAQKPPEKITTPIPLIDNENSAVKTVVDSPVLKSAASGARPNPKVVNLEDDDGVWEEPKTTIDEAPMRPSTAALDDLKEEQAKPAIKSSENEASITVQGSLDANDSDHHPLPRVDDHFVGVEVTGLGDASGREQILRQSAIDQQTSRNRIDKTFKPHFFGRSIFIFSITVLLSFLVGSAITLPLLLKKIRPAQSHGKLIITTSTTAACSVSVDSRPRKILIPETSVNLDQIEAGMRQIELLCFGYQPFVSTIEVKESQLNYLEAKLVKQ